MNIYAEIVPPATETATNSTAPRAQSWRDTLPIHPAAELFPLMSPDELAALGEDIRKHGLTSSIVLWSDGKSQALLLDGRSRLDAIEIAIRGPAIVGAPSLIAGKNFLACNKVIVLDRSVDPVCLCHQRQHPSPPSHRRAQARTDRQADRGRPEKSDRQIAKTVKVDHKTVASVRAEKEGRGEIPHGETRTNSKGRRQLARKTTTKPPRVSAEVLQQREAAAERIRGLRGGNKVHDDIGSRSAGECERLRSRNEELQAQLTHFAFQNIALRSEVKETRAVRKPEGEGEDSELVGSRIAGRTREIQGARRARRSRAHCEGHGRRARHPTAGRAMTLGSHQSSIGKTQVHITPNWIIEVLGACDLDPAAADPRPWDCAVVNYTERDDGLQQPWFGRVFLNPPFDRSVVPCWVRKLARHGCGTALLHARTETDWFEPIWETATAILFMADQLSFHQPDGTPHVVPPSAEISYS